MPYYQRDDQLQQSNAKEVTMNQRVEQILNTVSAAETLKGENNFLNYIIHKDQVLFYGVYSSIYACFNHQDTDSTLICRVFQPTAKIDPYNNLYLKILRFIGRKSPHIIATMDIFYDETRHIYLFQEFANRGNCLEYMRSGNYIELKQMAKWAISIWKAMDFIGDCAIVHRSIRPKHILLKSNPNGELVAKLSGFRDAIIYWDTSRNDIVQVPRRPWADIRFASFQAPETYSKQDNETFDPIDADVWSFGATFFYIVSRTYPFDLNNCEDITQIDKEIKHRINETWSLSEDIKRWFFALMQVDPKQRTKFQNIINDPWLRSEMN